MPTPNSPEPDPPTGPGATASGKRVVITGATGNVGSALVRALALDPEVASVLGLARRVPHWTIAKTTWAPVDLRDGDATATLTRYFRDADAVVHLAWMIQPARDPVMTWRTNVLGTTRVLRAVAEAQVPALLYASSVGAYSPGPQDRAVTENWPTHGWPEASYTREKAYVERLLDAFEPRHPGTRVVRLRPGFIFSREAASAQRRLFLGPLVFGPLVRPERSPVVPDVPGLRVQVIRASDAAEAYRRALHAPVTGAFNIAADPVVDAALLGRLFDARPVRVPRPLLRTALAAAYGAHLAPAQPELFDALMRLPVMDCSRAAAELGWRPAFSAERALRDLVHGLREGTGMDTPPLAARLRHGRLSEFATGIGQRP
ncbi:NAD-dependent epimerase/dehydratase family protein [Streptomyces sp. 7-21]|jgi:UDP-glucose 4-epimerase|uniref:NAD-dependent epimerase/dehydratase family protein n=1 Tax=Streptomyces sp. 7-21 TaxID=2802283 RepID=UPI00191FA729|nr:NAD-dependent epimerase/dehydratase family protein [Streptomyces sp. 7-21]MBL1065200.1 NAD-dependent epimerase/dehydratase family protein [Streptomyces sp. 7-21]